MLNAIRLGFLGIIAVLCLSSTAVAQDKPANDLTSIETFTDELIAAKTKEERDALLAAKKELVTPELSKELIKNGAALFKEGDYVRALDIYDLSRKIAEQTGDNVAVGDALNEIGNINLLRGEPMRALERYTESLKLFEALERKEKIARALNNIGEVYKMLGDYGQALFNYRKSLSISEELNDREGIASVLNNTALVCYYQGDYDRALETYHKSLELGRQLGSKPMIATILSNIGLVHHSRGDYQQALDLYGGSLSIVEELKDKEGIARMLNNMGELYRTQGNYKKALECFGKSLTICEELGISYGIATILNNIGLVHYFQGNYKQAFEFYKRSLSLFESLGDKASIAQMLNNIGNICRSQDDLDQAIEYYQKSLRLAEELGAKASISLTLNNIGEAYRNKEKYNEALTCFVKSLAISSDLKDKTSKAIVMSNMAYISLLQKDYSKAIKLAGDASEIAKEINDPEQIWRARLLAGTVHKVMGDDIQCRKAFEEAISTIEALRTQVGGGEKVQQIFFENKITPYHEMVGLLIRQSYFDRAFEYAERSKARVLLDVLQSGKSNISKTMLTQEQEQERKLKYDLISLNTQLYREKQREKINETLLSEIEKRLDKARLELEAFQTGLYASHPELKVQRAEIEPVAIEETSSLLPNPQSALLEFVAAEDKTYLFVVTQDQKTSKADAFHRSSRLSGTLSPTLKVYTIDIKQKDLSERVRSFRAMLASKDLAFRKPGSELYNLLLKPAEEQLKSINTLVIIPEGVLWELPFQVLQGSQNRYLLEDFAIFYAPSLTALREMTTPRKDESKVRQMKTLLALGNPTLRNTSNQSSSSTLLGETLLPLPGAEIQVKELVRLYGSKQSKYYIGAEARELQVKIEAGNYRILQFATHGILNDASPMYSHLVLSQLEQSKDEDGLLEAWEIMQMDLHADMAVLAACETARGKVSAGEGVIGLTWAFFVAGCPTTIVSQWKVEDDATKDLMLEFHRLLKVQGKKSKLTKAEALRRAALKILRAGKDTHPFYWAGFVLIGNGR